VPASVQDDSVLKPQIAGEPARYSPLTSQQGEWRAKPRRFAGTLARRAE
jgi:hypothetical protein